LSHFLVVAVEYRSRDKKLSPQLSRSNWRVNINEASRAEDRTLEVGKMGLHPWQMATRPSEADAQVIIHFVSFRALPNSHSLGLLMQNIGRTMTVSMRL